jgi:Fe-S cluster assembly protein SufD
MAGTALDRQVRVSHAAAHTASAIDGLALAYGDARAVLNAHTRIAPGAEEAVARQRLSGVPTGGQPKLVLRPHLEILHDKVQAAHGATWGALPEDALFYARQRGLDEQRARGLIVEGMARAVLERSLGDAELLETLAVDDRLARVVARHLASEDGHA